jgi:hypothetical protein
VPSGPFERASAIQNQLADWMSATTGAVGWAFDRELDLDERRRLAGGGSGRGQGN